MLLLRLIGNMMRSTILYAAWRTLVPHTIFFCLTTPPITHVCIATVLQNLDSSFKQLVCSPDSILSVSNGSIGDSDDGLRVPV